MRGALRLTLSSFSLASHSPDYVGRLIGWKRCFVEDEVWGDFGKVGKRGKNEV